MMPIPQQRPGRLDNVEELAGEEGEGRTAKGADERRFGEAHEGLFSILRPDSVLLSGFFNNGEGLIPSCF